MTAALRKQLTPLSSLGVVTTGEQGQVSVLWGTLRRVEHFCFLRRAFVEGKYQRLLKPA